MAKAGASILIDTKQFSMLVRGIRASGPAGKAAVRGAMAESAAIVKAEAARRASFSRRIPASLKARATATNFKVSAGGEAAPNAAPIENKGRGFVRHPIFVPLDKLPGPPGSWTEKNSHPAVLSPAFEATEEEVIELITDRLTDAVAKAIGAR
jgi:hypothetical protein